METITNGPAYHFYFEPDSVGIKAYLQNVKDYVNSVGKDNSVLSAFDPVSQYDKASKSLKSFKGEAWIGKNDNLPQKIVISATSLVNADKPENGEFTVNIVAILKDWNKPLEVKAPVDSMSFAELMNQVMGQARTKAMDDSIKNSLTSFHSSADVFFQNASSYKGICLSKGAKDVSKQIKSINNGTSQFSCLDTKSKYIASVKLGDNTYFCTDSVGNTKGIPSKPIGFVCQ